MNLRRFFSWVIALTVTAGLLAAPLAASAFAKSNMAASGEMQAMDEPAMAGDMPCCPDEGKANDCASCPLLALCMLSISIPLPAEANALVMRSALHETFATPDDAWVQGLGGHPPDHPPRSNA